MKEKQVNTIDALFREELGSARVQPSDKVWENIQQQLNTQPEEAVVAFPWKIWVAAASVGVLLAVGLTLLLNQPLSPDATELAEGTNEVLQPAEAGTPETTVPIENGMASSFGDQKGGITNPPVQETAPAPSIPPAPLVAFAPASSPDRNQQEKATSVPPAPRKVLATLPLDSKKPSGMTAFVADLPSRTGNDLDEPYAFISPEKVALELPDFDKINDLQEPEEGRWAVGGMFSPDISVISSSPGANEMFQGLDPSGEFSSSQYQDMMQVAPSRAFSSGISLGYAVTERIEVQGALTYSQRTSVTPGGNYLLANADRMSAYENADPYRPEFTNAFIEMPVLMRYRLRPKKKLDVYVSSGVSTQLFVKNETEFAGTDAALGSVESFSTSADVIPLTPYQLNLLVGGGAEYTFGKHISAQLEPILRKSLVGDRNVYAGNPDLSVSIRTGLNYNF